LKALAPALLEAVSDMSAATLSSPYFKRSLKVAPVVTNVQPVPARRKGRPKAA
jgi:hypothetical protein